MACVRRLQLQCLYLTLISLLSPAALVASITLNVSPPPDCPDKCGNITIPYPFGTRPECRRDDGFNITCNEPTTAPKAFLGSDTSNIELIDINIKKGEARVYKFIAYRCYNKSNQVSSTNYGASINLTSSPYLFSNRRNKFTAIGCDALAFILGQGNTNSLYASGCMSFCESQIFNNTTGEGVSCNELRCCQTAIPANLNYYNVSWGYDTNLAWGFNPCIYAALVEEDSYKFQVQDLSEVDFLVRNQHGLPAVLDWAIRDNGTCQNGVEESPNPACLSKNSTCSNTSNGEGYLCQCMDGFDGNPYIQGGCTDINECKLPDIYACHQNCRNTEGSYECFCRKGTRGNATIGNCTDNFPLPAKVATC